MLPELGVGLIWSGLGAVVVSICAYLIGLRGDRSAEAPRPLGQRLGRAAFAVAALCVLGAAAVHATLLLTHRFDINYVYRYSARGLPPFYLFATFWAGQEGSFLLWAFWTSLLGIALAFTSGRRLEGRVMPIYGGVLAFLLALLVVKSPFALYAPVSPMDPQTLTPPDGIGLNPLLENPWMVVHPPTLFLGFSSLAVPFAFAVSALIWGDVDNWYRRTWPWALLGWSVLGFGIMLGGYWAYETLGWGGFWGWDPVENGPLVPWLGMTAFLHAAQTQRARGSLKKTALFLGMFPFVLALYETFLTRTGILDKFSNHSFSTLGGVANSVILYTMLGAVVASICLLAWRARRIKNESGALDDATSRDFGLTLAIALLLACAVITGAGMSAPLITQAGVALHIVNNQSSVQQDFYNKANFPVACLLLIGMAVGPYLAWKQTSPKSFEPLVWVYMGAVGSALAFFIASRALFGGSATVPMLLMFTFAVLCILANIRLLGANRARGGAAALAGLRTAGGALAHIGAATLLLGVVFLVAWYRQDDQILVQGHSREVSSFPMTVTFAGTTSDLHDPTNQLKIDVLEGRSGAQTHYVAMMPVAVRTVEGQKKLLARPAIVHRWWGDLYFALKDGPEQISPTALIKTTLHKGEVKEIAGYHVRFDRFEVPPDVGAMVQRGEMPAVFPVTAHLEVTAPGGAVSNIAANFVRYRDDPLGDNSPEVKLPLGPDKLPYALAFTGMNADDGSAQFYVRDAGMPPVTAYTIEVSTRPMIGLVWLGTLLMAAGGLLSSRRRALENRLLPVPDPAALETVPEALPRRPAGAGRRTRTAPAPAKGGN